MYLSLCFFTDTATTEIYTLSLHDALPISARAEHRLDETGGGLVVAHAGADLPELEERELLALPVAEAAVGFERLLGRALDRKSTRLNSSHANISYAVFCLKKKK